MCSILLSYMRLITAKVIYYMLKDVHNILFTMKDTGMSHFA